MKNDAESVKRLMDLLSATYADEEVKKYSDLKSLILRSATELEKTENVDLICSQLSKQLVVYYLSHKKEFPKAALDLYNKISGHSMKYDSTALAAIMLPAWFGGIG